MTTKLYFHNALTGDTGTLPTAIQSAMNGGVASNSVDAATVNRSMDTNIGTSQTSKSFLQGGTGNNQTFFEYFTRFCSSPLQVTSIAANTWTVNYATSTSAASTKVDFPAANLSTPNNNLTLYVWRPSNGTKVGTVFDNTAVTGISQKTSASQLCDFGTIAGSAVTCQVNDILCVEAFLICFHNGVSAPSSTLAFFYDGTTETNSDAAASSSEASYVSTPQNNLFGGAAAATVYPNFFSTVGFRPSQQVGVRPAPGELANVPPHFTTFDQRLEKNIGG